jgi:hypothetical protein
VKLAMLAQTGTAGGTQGLLTAYGFYGMPVYARFKHAHPSRNISNGLSNVGSVKKLATQGMMQGQFSNMRQFTAFCLVLKFSCLNYVK